MLFKKKNEFRPDKTDSGMLNKLYITKKQRLSLLKWALTAFALVLISVLQDVVLCRIHLLGATTDLLCGALLLVCIMMDPEQGCIFILLGSVAYHFSGTSPGPYVIALLTGIGLLVSIFRQAYLHQSFAATFLCTGVAILAYEMLLGIIGAFLGNTTLSRMGIFALSGIYTVVAIPALYPVFRGIGKIGGETWKD
jgi:hypothetical protein